MSEITNGPEGMEALRGAIRRIVNLLVANEYGTVVQTCSKTRLSADDIRAVVKDYGRRLVAPPASAYANLDAVRVTGAGAPRWSVRAPLYTAGEGMSDLTLELTIVRTDTSLEVELEDIHVL